MMMELRDYPAEARRLVDMARTEVQKQLAVPVAGPWVPMYERPAATAGAIADEWMARLDDLRAKARAEAARVLAAVDVKLAEERRERGPRDWAEVAVREKMIAEEVASMDPGAILMAYQTAQAAKDRAGAYLIEREARRILQARISDPDNMNAASIREAREGLGELARRGGDFDRRRAEAEASMAATLAEIDAAIPSYDQLSQGEAPAE